MKTSISIKIGYLNKNHEPAHQCSKQPGICNILEMKDILNWFKYTYTNLLKEIEDFAEWYWINLLEELRTVSRMRGPECLPEQDLPKIYWQQSATFCTSIRQYRPEEKIVCGDLLFDQIVMNQIFKTHNGIPEKSKENQEWVDQDYQDLKVRNLW